MLSTGCHSHKDTNIIYKDINVAMIIQLHLLYILLTKIFSDIYQNKIT